MQITDSLINSDSALWCISVYSTQHLLLKLNAERPASLSHTEATLTDSQFEVVFEENIRCKSSPTHLK